MLSLCSDAKKWAVLHQTLSLRGGVACETNCRCNTDGEKLVETSKVVFFENCFLST